MTQSRFGWEGIYIARCLGRGLGGTPSMRVRITKHQHPIFATLSYTHYPWLRQVDYTNQHYLRFTTPTHPPISYTFLHIWKSFFLQFRLMVVHQFRYTDYTFLSPNPTLSKANWLPIFVDSDLSLSYTFQASLPLTTTTIISISHNLSLP